MATSGDFEGVYTQTGRYINEFEEITPIIGVCGHGAVSKARHKVYNKEYAIKHLLIKDKEDLINKTREIKMWVEVDSVYVVQHRSSWLEDLEQADREAIVNVLCKTKSPKYAKKFWDKYAKIPFRILHMQMDLCDFSLEEAIIKIKDHFKVIDNQLLPKMAYYIISELMIEILVSIEYLHSNDIMHRDIKPANILIKKGPNGKFIKVSDFGLSVLHKEPGDLHTYNVGTDKYMAPEVRNTKGVTGTRIEYGMEADVYSIGKMALELFNVDIGRQRDLIVDQISNILLKEKYRSVMAIIGSAINNDIKQRPTCADFSRLRSNWTLELNDVKIELNGYDLTKDYDITNDFVQNFLKTKIEFKRKNN